MLVTSNNGYILRPKTSDNLILHIKDLNLVNLDKWGSNMLVSFLQQVSELTKNLLKFFLNTKIKNNIFFVSDHNISWIL